MAFVRIMALGGGDTGVGVTAVGVIGDAGVGSAAGCDSDDNRFSRMKKSFFGERSVRDPSAAPATAKYTGTSVWLGSTPAASVMDCG